MLPSKGYTSGLKMKSEEAQAVSREKHKGKASDQEDLRKIQRRERIPGCVLDNCGSWVDRVKLAWNVLAHDQRFELYPKI